MRKARTLPGKTGFEAAPDGPEVQPVLPSGAKVRPASWALVAQTGKMESRVGAPWATPVRYAIEGRQAERNIHESGRSRLLWPVDIHEAANWKFVFLEHSVHGGIE